MKRAVLMLGALLTAGGCDGVPAASGADEPLRAQAAQFYEGELPGLSVEDQPEDLDALLELTPRVTSVDIPNRTFRPRQSGITIRGRTTPDAYSFALRLADVGSGYWVRPVGAENPGFDGELEWVAVIELSADIPPGTHTLESVAFDEAGKAGPHTTVDVCVTRDVEHSSNACNPEVLPPAAIISLRWDNDADVDLVVVTPDGTQVDAKHPLTLADVEDGEEPDLEAPGVGAIDIDSGNACEPDGRRRETLSFPGSPERGSYLVYANLFDACGERAAHFTVESFVRTAGEDEGAYDLGTLAPAVHGILLPASANGGRKRGLYVTTIEFP